MKPILAATVSLLMTTGSAWGQSASTGRADDNYGSNAAAGNNASTASTDPSANKAATAKKSLTNRKVAKRAAPENPAVDTTGALTTARPEATAKVAR